MRQLCDGGGVRASPTDDELRSFVAAAATLDGTFLATALQVRRSPVAPLSPSPRLTSRRRCTLRGADAMRIFESLVLNLVCHLSSAMPMVEHLAVTRCYPPQRRSPHSKTLGSVTPVMLQSCSIPWCTVWCATYPQPCVWLSIGGPPHCPPQRRSPHPQTPPIVTRAFHAPFRGVQ